MSVRPIDEPIPGDELLYRSVADADVVDGVLRETAVDLQGMSVFRQKYCPTADDALQRSKAAGRTHHSGVVETKPSLFSEPVSLNNNTQWEAFAVDAPSETEDVAHAEIRTRREGDPSREADKPKSASAKLQLKHWLAAKMRVALPPSPP